MLKIVVWSVFLCSDVRSRCGPYWWTMV